jgi:hypothetical protein
MELDLSGLRNFFAALRRLVASKRFFTVVFVVAVIVGAWFAAYSGAEETQSEDLRIAILATATPSATAPSGWWNDMPTPLSVPTRATP